MRVLSVNVGLPREVIWRGKPVATAAISRRRSRTVSTIQLNLGDRRPTSACTAVRTRPCMPTRPSSTRALVARAARTELARARSATTSTEDLLDGDVSVGSRCCAQDCRLSRDPAAAFLLQARDQDGTRRFVSEFLERGLYGFYLAVTREGEVQAGDPIVGSTATRAASRVSEVARLYARPRRRRRHATRSRPRRASGRLVKCCCREGPWASGVTHAGGDRYRCPSLNRARTPSVCLSDSSFS